MKSRCAVQLTSGDPRPKNTKGEKRREWDPPMIARPAAWHVVRGPRQLSFLWPMPPPGGLPASLPVILRANSIFSKLNCLSISKNKQMCSPAFLFQLIFRSLRSFQFQPVMTAESHLQVAWAHNPFTAAFCTQLGAHPWCLLKTPWSYCHLPMPSISPNAVLLWFLEKTDKGNYPRALVSPPPPSEEATCSPSTQPRVDLSLPNLA